MMFEFLHFTVIDLLDILMVAGLLYFLFRFIKGSSAINIFIAIIIVLLVQLVATALGMKMVSSVLGTVINVGAIAIIIIFQPELRRLLSSLGRSAGSKLEQRTFLLKLFPKKISQSADTEAMKEIAEACRTMGEQKTGALILLRKNDSLEDIISTGDIIMARVSSRLIMNIFFKNSPLHDGAMVIGDNHIIAARCTLPITDRVNLPAHYGMRHKAAIGVSEQCDADVLVVSEETGKISHVRNGVIRYIDSINELKLILEGKDNE